MKTIRLAMLICGTALLYPARAFALPVFAHRYGLTCQACHTTVPHLNPFGEAFLHDGFRPPPGLPLRPDVFPVALKVNLQYSSLPDPDGLPKAIVDEIELLAAGPVTHHVSYRLEQYVVDGGEPGLTRDAWLQFTSRPAFGDTGSALRVTGGQFTLPLPVDPETQRETINHYQIFDQKVGDDPFDFFNDGIGIDAAYGRESNGTIVHLMALKGHDPQSGLPTSGVDSGAYVQTGGTTTDFSAYYHGGTRRFGSVLDVFNRQGLGANVYLGKAEADLLVQQGFDSAATASAIAARSSGGFAQLRWSFSPALTALSRYDTTYGPFVGLQQSLTTTMVVRVQRNAKVTVEDVFAGHGQQTLNAAFLFAY